MRYVGIKRFFREIPYLSMPQYPQDALRQTAELRLHGNKEGLELEMPSCHVNLCAMETPYQEPDRERKSSLS